MQGINWFGRLMFSPLSTDKAVIEGEGLKSLAHTPPPPFFTARICHSCHVHTKWRLITWVNRTGVIVG